MNHRHRYEKTQNPCKEMTHKQKFYIEWIFVIIFCLVDREEGFVLLVQDQENITENIGDKTADAGLKLETRHLFDDEEIEWECLWMMCHRLNN